jgi:peroxiredoxin
MLLLFLCHCSVWSLLCACCAFVQQVTPRNPAPTFSAMAVVDEKFVKVSLKQYLDKGKWIVLLFYPFDFTFV